MSEVITEWFRLNLLPAYIQAMQEAGLDNKDIAKILYRVSELVNVDKQNVEVAQVIK